jgi:hypothetical protein
LNLGQTAATDQTTYEAFVVTTGTFGDLNAITLYFLAGDPIVDVQHEEAARTAGSPGRLIVADVIQGGQVTSSVAAAVSLGTRGDGYLVAAILPSGGMGRRARGLHARARVVPRGRAPGFWTFPATGGSA